MNEDELRIKIYEYLGLEVGSLASESGNDWQIAKKEVLLNNKQEILKEISIDQQQDFRTIDKNSESYIFALTTKLPKFESSKNLIAARNDLECSDIEQLILTGSKEVILNLIRLQQLTAEQIDMIIPKTVYLSKITLLSKQNLTEIQKKNILRLMKEFPDTYKDSILMLENGLYNNNQ